MNIIFKMLQNNWVFEVISSRYHNHMCSSLMWSTADYKRLRIKMKNIWFLSNITTRLAMSWVWIWEITLISFDKSSCWTYTHTHEYKSSWKNALTFWMWVWRNVLTFILHDCESDLLKSNHVIFLQYYIIYRIWYTNFDLSWAYLLLNLLYNVYFYT